MEQLSNKAEVRINTIVFKICCWALGILFLTGGSWSTAMQLKVDRNWDKTTIIETKIDYIASSVDDIKNDVKIIKEKIK